MGPCLANGSNNDSSIITHNINSNCGKYMDFMKDVDILVVDQGFYNALDYLNDCGFITEMPTFHHKSMKQHTTMYLRGQLVKVRDQSTLVRRHS